jgi:hypothetical protein
MVSLATRIGCLNDRFEACHATSSIRGDKEPWITHLLGGKGTTACIHVTDAARKEARIHKDLEDAKATGRAGKRSAPAQRISGDVAFAAGPSTSTSGPRHDRTASGADEPASKRFKQGSFQVFTGRDQPFTTAETEEIQAQVLRATVSAGLPFRMWENPEVVRLVRMFRTAGPDVLPSRKVVGGRLLNEAAEKVEGTVKAVLEMKEVGLMYVRIFYQTGTDYDTSHSARTGGSPARRLIGMGFALTSITRYFLPCLWESLFIKYLQTYTLELIDMTAHSKDGPALCKLFSDMIDRVETKYKCYVIYFITDADGGSKKGRVLLGKQRPWLFVPSCWAHQVRLRDLY